MNEKRLLDVYNNTMGEYRFQVRLNWDRMRFLLSLNIIIFTAAVGVLRLSASVDYLFLVALIFGIGIILGIFSQFITRRGHEYYRDIIRQKTRIERALMLHDIEGLDTQKYDLSLSTTEGMKRQGATVNESNAPTKVIRKGTVVYYFYHGFSLLMLLHGIGLALVVVAFLNQ